MFLIGEENKMKKSFDLDGGAYSCYPSLASVPFVAGQCILVVVIK